MSIGGLEYAKDDASMPPRPARKISRIVVLVLDSLHSGVALHQFINAYRDRIVCIVSSDKIWGAAGEGLLKETNKYFRRSGIAYLLYLSMMQWLFRPCAHVAKIIHKITGREQRTFTLRQICKKNGLMTIRARDINSPDFVSRIADMEPDIVVLLYFDQILKEPIIAVPKYGVLNVHPGILPDNRGPAPGFWAAYMQHENIGATVHMVDDPQVDVGPVLATRSVKRDRNQSVVALDCESMRMGAELAIKAVLDIENGTSVPIRQDHSRAKYYGHPTRGDIKLFWRQGGRLFHFSDLVEQFRSSSDESGQPGETT